MNLWLVVEPGLQHARQFPIGRQIPPLLGITRLGPQAQGDDSSLTVQFLNRGLRMVQLGPQP